MLALEVNSNGKQQVMTCKTLIYHF